MFRFAQRRVPVLYGRVCNNAPRRGRLRAHELSRVRRGRGRGGFGRGVINLSASTRCTALVIDMDFYLSE